MGGLQGLTVPGLKNIGNTCFAAAVLQALASCRLLVRQLELATSELEGLELEGESFTVLLLDCLHRLQPLDAAAAAASESPAAVLHALRQCVGANVLPAGEEHDAVEAFEVIAALVGSELQRAFMCCTKSRLEARGSLSALLQARGPLRAMGVGVGGQHGLPAAQAVGTAHEPRAAARNAAKGQPDEGANTTAASSCGGGGGSSSPEPAGRTCTGGLCASQLQQNGLAAGASTCQSFQGPIAFSSDSSSSSEARGPLVPGPRQHPQAGSVAAVNGVEDAPQCSDTLQEGQQCMDQAAVSSGAEGPGNGSGAACREQQDGDELLATPGWASVDAVLSCWQATTRLLCQGSLASKLQCLRCRHLFSAQVTPFLSLPLAIPLAHDDGCLGYVPAISGASLLDCLRDFFGKEGLQGVPCTRCSLQATLAAIPAGSLDAQLESWQQALQQRSALLESEMYEEVIRRAGLDWVARCGPVAKQHVVARLPSVLCLQLRRTAWTAAGEVKISGHVRFPLQLQLDVAGVPVFGDELHTLAVEERCEEGAPSSAYLLRAVLVHYGGVSSCGHYVVYRSLDLAGRQWARVSDEQVMAGVTVEEVLDAEAAMLVYECARA